MTDDSRESRMSTVATGTGVQGSHQHARPVTCVSAQNSFHPHVALDYHYRDCYCNYCDYYRCVACTTDPSQVAFARVTVANAGFLIRNRRPYFQQPATFWPGK